MLQVEGYSAIRTVITHGQQVVHWRGVPPCSGGVDITPYVSIPVCVGVKESWGKVLVYVHKRTRRRNKAMMINENMNSLSNIFDYLFHWHHLRVGR